MPCHLHVQCGRFKLVFHFPKVLPMHGSSPFLGSSGGGLLSLWADLAPAEAALGGDALLWGDGLDGGGGEAGFADGGGGGGEQLVLLLVLPTGRLLGNFLPLLCNQRWPQTSHYHIYFDMLRSHCSISTSTIQHCHHITTFIWIVRQHILQQDFI